MNVGNNDNLTTLNLDCSGGNYACSEISLFCPNSTHASCNIHLRSDFGPLMSYAYIYGYNRYVYFDGRPAFDGKYV